MSPEAPSRRALLFGAAALVLLAQLAWRATALAAHAPVTAGELVELGRLHLPIGSATAGDPIDLVPWAGRLRGLAIAALVVLVTVLSRTTSVRMGAESALLAVALVACDRHLIALAALAPSLAFLALLLALALLAFSRYLARRSLAWCGVACVLLALALAIRCEVAAVLPALAIVVFLALARAKLPDCMDLPLPLAMRARLGTKHVARYLACQAGAIALVDLALAHQLLPPCGAAAVLPIGMAWWRYLPALGLLAIAIHVWALEELYPHGHHLLTVALAVPLVLLALVRGAPSLAAAMAVLPLGYVTLADFVARRFEMSRTARPLVALLVIAHLAVNLIG